MKLYKDLDAAEEAAFRKWAHDNYKAFSDISGLWHPVVQDECRKINVQSELDLQWPVGDVWPL